MNTIAPISVMALVAISTVPAFASNPMEETVIVSSRIAMPLRQVGTSVSVITAEDLKIRGFNTLANTMRYEPGISVVNNGGAGKATSLRIRGESGYRTKAFIDGMELTDTSSPQAGPQFEHLTSGGVSRVEILRGPQGVMYGADAGGVVNISTARASEGFGGTVSAESGRYGTLNLIGNIGGRNETGDFTIIASNFKTDGFNSRDLDTTPGDDDGYNNETYYVQGGWNITQQLRAEMQGRSVEGDNEFDSCSTPSPDFSPSNLCSNDHEEDSWRAALRYASETHTGEVSYTNTNTDRDFLTQGVSTFATKGELEEFSYLGNWKLQDDLNIVYGVDLRNAAIDDGVVDTDRDQNGYFLEYQSGFNDSFFVTVGARYDDNDDFGSETTYRLSGAYLIPAGDGEIKLKSTYGTGFRAPSLSEIAYNTSFNAFPPALGLELAAEKSEGFDLGAGYFADSGWYVEVTYFDQQIKDEIFFDLADFSGYLQGDGDSPSEGVELVAEAPITDVFSVSGNYTYNDAEDADGARRARAPEHLANLGVHMNAMEGNLQLNLNLRISRDAPEEANGKIDNYEVLDISANYQVLDGLELFVRVENLSDEDYQELPTYNTAGAAGYVGVRYSFQSDT